MRPVISACAALILGAGPTLADPAEERANGRQTDGGIRSGLVVEPGLDIARVRPGTRCFEIHG